MSRLSRANIGLLIVVAALAAVVYLRPSRDQFAGHALSARLPAHAAAIRIEREGSPVTAIKRQGEIWRLTAPVSAEADSFQIQRILELLTVRTAHRFPPSALERFELDRPQVRLTIDEETFAFGMVSSVSGEQYVLARDAVYAIEPRYGAALLLDAMHLVRKQLLSSSEVPLRFEIGEFSVAQQDGKWRLAPPGELPSQDELARWVEYWRHAAALRVAPLVPRPPIGKVRIDLKSGASVTLGIVQRAPELVIARDDEMLQYHMPDAVAQRLLAPPRGEQAVNGKR